MKMRIQHIKSTENKAKSLSKEKFMHQKRKTSKNQQLMLSFQGTKKKKNSELRSAWLAHSVKHPTLDFVSDHNLRVFRSSPAFGSILNMEPA